MLLNKLQFLYFKDEEKPVFSIIKEAIKEVREKSKTLASHSNTYPMTGTSGIISNRSCNRVSRERRRSAGDEQELRDQQLNMFLKTHTDSGKKLTDIVSYLIINQNYFIY